MKYFYTTGDLSPEERLNVLSRYREGQERVLICTNVLARGIDVDSVGYNFYKILYTIPVYKFKI